MDEKKATVRATLRDDDRIRTMVFMRNLLTRMNINSDMQVKEEGDTITVILDGSASALIGHRGQTLDSLQYLIARFLNDDKEEWLKVVVDIDNYRDRREDNLRSLAERLASQVVRTQRNFKTEPLTAPERRVIHMTLKEHPDVTTFSIGTGNRKRVVIASNTRTEAPKRRSGGSSGQYAERGGDAPEQRQSSGGRPSSSGGYPSTGGRPERRSSGGGGHPHPARRGGSGAGGSSGSGRGQKPSGGRSGGRRPNPSN